MTKNSIIIYMAEGKKDDNWLIFIDTNILLDFYRARNESGLKLLEHIDSIHKKLITSFQLEMEFKKNRQLAIRESYHNLKVQPKIALPTFMADLRISKAVNNRIEKSNKGIKTLRDKLKKVLREPTKSDPVYSVVQRLFSSDETNSLKAEDSITTEILDRARQRIERGQSPKKPKDASIGDAIHWEWIVEVASKQKKDIIVVSRDTDFGITLDGESYINDALAQEFRDRVGSHRKIVLVDLLSKALKKSKVKVTISEKNAEEEIAAEAWNKFGLSLGSGGSAQEIDKHEYLLKLISAILDPI